ncbi:arogenate dehydrogenase (NADP+), plant [Marchantia polymorpha subsp. ruderalis]|uniref:Prephenate/arogenate dehydrogenase domain-containing protein n=1 Tax=Marchantia polymorpha TaxID=3197 RepID=A0A2R6X7S7_MARPO|nr:hypothetical protein MARPO_0031s0116 [Marchantia polymorpha]BBN01099.1 hypothetical protein Mp_2g04610 [Marchantia polymorpha subsp. ruderalis]|eukprot:PTQ42148.1 hypothetical protein MARPO_0031s0116 [Marchantia polymorpha]
MEVLSPLISGHSVSVSGRAARTGNRVSSRAPCTSHMLKINCTFFGSPVSSACCGQGTKIRRSYQPGQAFAIDAAQGFDYESIRLHELQMKNRLKVGIVGFGNFGQFLAQRIVKQGHTVLAHSRSDYGAIARKLGVTYFRDADDFCEEHPEVVILCTSILSTESVLASLPIQRLKRNTLFVDVLSVKEFPRNLFLQVLPSEFDVLCTHPMFGPESGRGSWAGLPLVYDKVRIRDGPRTERCRKFLNIFESEGCRMVEMTCEEHDVHAAGSQFITHTVGRVLGSLGLESTPINTKGYESLLRLVENTYSDSFDLYYGLFLYNKNATEELQNLERAFDTVKSQLFDKLHSILRQQMLMKSEDSKEPNLLKSAPPTVKTLLLSDNKNTAAPAVKGIDVNINVTSNSKSVPEVLSAKAFQAKAESEIS